MYGRSTAERLAGADPTVMIRRSFRSGRRVKGSSPQRSDSFPRMALQKRILKLEITLPLWSCPPREPPLLIRSLCKLAVGGRQSRPVHLALHPYPATLTLCPYLDCRANATRDAWRWATIQREHPDYPVRPELNVIYRR